MMNRPQGPSVTFDLSLGLLVDGKKLGAEIWRSSTALMFDLFHFLILFVYFHLFHETLLIVATSFAFSGRCLNITLLS